MRLDFDYLMSNRTHHREESILNTSYEMIGISIELSGASLPRELFFARFLDFAFAMVVVYQVSL